MGLGPQAGARRIRQCAIWAGVKPVESPCLTDLAVCCADPAFERIPFGNAAPSGPARSLHQVLLSGWGVHIGTCGPRGEIPVSESEPTLMHCELPNSRVARSGDSGSSVRRAETLHLLLHASESQRHGRSGQSAECHGHHVVLPFVTSASDSTRHLVPSLEAYISRYLCDLMHRPVGLNGATVRVTLCATGSYPSLLPAQCTACCFAPLSQSSGSIASLSPLGHAGHAGLCSQPSPPYSAKPAIPACRAEDTERRTKTAGGLNEKVAHYD